MQFNFPIVIIDEDFRSENTSGSGIRALAAALQANGMKVEGYTSYIDLRSFAQQQARASAFILSLDDDEDINHDGEVPDSVTITELRQFIQEIRSKNAEIPIYLYGETRTARHLPNDILRELHGFLHMFEDTPEFVARHIIREAKSYLEHIQPPFFKALHDYAEEGSYSWHSPGHSGGVAFLKSPIGQMFYQFFGENLLRADVSTSVDELGGLLDHIGPIAQAERNAARIFNADHCFFVTNGTSTANKMVWHSTVAPGDIVVIDRNCHKSIMHSIMMIGAIPVYLKPTRNRLGIIGPISEDSFSIESINQRIAQHPFAQHAKNLQPRILTLTQSTYDGILYNTQRIKSSLDGKILTLHFDEAWVPHGAFHPHYQGMHALPTLNQAEDLQSSRCQQSMVFATQSTHKLLAGLSQASQILVQDAEQQKLDFALFNQSYLMHTSTSPQYAIIASLDVAAAMMEAPGGTALVNESILEALDFRRAMRKITAEYQSTGGVAWWFSVWEPEQLPADGVGTQADWLLDGKSNWHGFQGVRDGFNMLDPIKVTILTPGLNLQGEFASFGIPATIVSKYLAEHGIVIEKTGLYSFFVMFTIGITKGRWNTLLSALQQFKDDVDRNAQMGRILPEFVAKNPSYERRGLREVCSALHAHYADKNVAELINEIYLDDAEIACLPSVALAAVAHKNIERVPIDELQNRISSCLIVPYPPGIPLLVPGERFSRAVVGYLQFARAFNAQFPGFHTDIHGLVIDEQGYFVDCLK